MSDRIYYGKVIPTPYNMAPAPVPGNCTGCLLFAEGAKSAACVLSGCQPRENPEGTGHRVVESRIESNKDVFIESTEVLAGVRNTDPATCYLAAAKVKVPTLRQAILSALLAGYRLTGKEIAANTGKPLNSITPRFKGLVYDGLIVDTGYVRDGQTVWRLA
jgi:hypothetical protein